MSAGNHLLKEIEMWSNAFRGQLLPPLAGVKCHFFSTPFGVALDQKDGTQAPQPTPLSHTHTHPHTSL